MLSAEDNNPATASFQTFVGPAQGPAAEADGQPRSVCQSCSDRAGPAHHSALGSWAPRIGPNPPVHSALPREPGAAGTALPALSTRLHDALEEHGVILHVGMLGRLQPVEGEEERAAAGHVGLTLGPLEGR